MADYGIPVQTKVLSDSTAAIGMVRRLGLGRVRHLATADLWLQQGVRNGSFTLCKHPTATNGADLMTKVKGRQDLFNLLGIMGFGSLSGRADIAPSGPRVGMYRRYHALQRQARMGLIQIYLIYLLCVREWIVKWRDPI